MPSHSKVIEISADFYFLSELFCKRQNCGPGEAAGVACFQGEKVATRTDNEIIFF